MTDGHCFISYSHADGLDFVKKLITELEGGYPHIPVWFEKRDIVADKDDWDDQLAKAIQQCKCLIYVMSQDSTADHSNCKDEWAWALKYKKPVLCLWIDNKAEDQFRLNSRQKIDFTADFSAGLGKLRKAIDHLDSPKGQLEELNHRLADANRDLRRASEEKKALIQSDIDELKKQIEAQQKIVNDPEAAKRETEQKIQNGLERERKPEKPLAAFQSSKFINQPPGVAQNHFRDRFTETEQAILFLKNEAQRVLTVVGRGGAGKTAMVCRLLKFVENGGLPDDFERKHGRVDVDGIVYLSEAGSRKVNFANLFEDLCKLLPAASAEKLSALYREPQTSTESKTVQLLAAFQGLKQVIVLLDNFENVVDAEKGQVRDAELDEALRAILHAPHHPVKILITTRVSARELDAFEPARQRLLPLDTGLQPEYAREAFVLMDEGNLVGIKNAGADLLNLAVTRTLGLPRALEALYAALRTDRFTTLQELLDLPILPEQVVQAYVGEAFNRLDTNAQKVMQALAVYNRPVTPAAVDYLLAAHLPAIDSAPILQRLANMHFARKESGRFYLHPVDREFAVSLLPEGNSNDKIRDNSGLKLLEYLTEAINKYPDLLENQEAFEKAETEFPQNFLRDIVSSLQSLDPALQEKMQDAKNFEDEVYLAALDNAIKIPQAYTRYALINRAADYFAQARKPRAEWKKLDDLSAQLAEFDLRCTAGDYDAAASVLTEIDFDYLLLWGHYRLVIDLHENLQGKISNKDLALFSVGNLGSAYYRIYKISDALYYYEQTFKLAKENNNRQVEGQWLMGMSICYSALGNIQKAFEFCEQALSIAREVNDRYGEGACLGNLGNRFYESGEYEKAIEFYEQALSIDIELKDRSSEGIDLGNLGVTYMALKDCLKAKNFYEKSLAIAREIGDKGSEHLRLRNLGNVYLSLGKVPKAIEFHEQAMVIAHEIGDRRGVGQVLYDLGNAYTDFGDTSKAMNFYEQALVIDREIGDLEGEGIDLGGIAEQRINLGEYELAIASAKQYVKIYEEINKTTSSAFGILAQVYLHKSELVKANEAIVEAEKSGTRQYNHNTSALHGIIALRQGDEVTARGAFVRAIGQADEILSKTAEYYSALDAKGLAICGLVLCNGRGDPSMPAETKDGKTIPSDETTDRAGRVAPTLEDAIETFRKARKIAPHAGVVKSVLRLFDELMKCEGGEILKDVRKAVEGK